MNNLQTAGALHLHTWTSLWRWHSLFIKMTLMTSHILFEIYFTEAYDLSNDVLVLVF